MYIEFPILSTYPQKCGWIVDNYIYLSTFYNKTQVMGRNFCWNTYTSGILKWNKCLKIRLDRLTIAYYN